MSQMVALPPTLAGCADRLFQVREERLAKQKEVDSLAAEENALKVYIIEELPKSDATGIAGKVARVTVVNKIVPKVEDWDKFYKYIAKTKSWEMLQRRVGEGAVRERWDAGREVPGVGHIQVPTVSINKV